MSKAHKTHHKMSKKSPKAKASWHWVALGGVALIAVVGVLLLGQAQEAVAPAAEISVSEAYQKYQKGVFLLDVRTVGEWNEVRVPNATLIPLDQLESRLNELPKEQDIMVICRSGNRSQTGRDILLSNGFARVTSVGGGVRAWKAAGYPVEEGTP